MEQVKTLLGGSAMWSSGFVPPRPTTARAVWTAPTAPVRPRAEPVASLDDLTELIDGVSGAILASVDGFGLARSTSMTDEASHPAMLAAAVGLAHQLVPMGGGTRLRQLGVDHDAGIMLVWPIGSERVLAVLATSQVDQRALRTAVQQRLAVFTGASA